jgi:peptide/nickel transport system ATP-binding protein
MNEPNEVVLSVRGLSTHFRTPDGVARAVDNISFDIHRGETFALVGESGCGKSVTALSIMQLVQKPAGFTPAGVIDYKGIDILRIPEYKKREVRGNEISMIFQEPMTSLNPVLTVGTQIVEVIERHRQVSRDEARRQAIDMLDQVRIPEASQRLGEYPHQLSGGMKQRVMIAIALACRPGLLIADEPTTALDVTIQEQILSLIRDLREELGTAVLLITHDLGVVAENADRIGVMYAGKIVEQASRDRLFSSPAHPYTARLLQSLPSRQEPGQALQTIEGRVPPATDFPEGCRFADRCHKVIDSCRTWDPEMIDIADGHGAACIHYDASRVPALLTPADMVDPGEARPRTDAPDSGTVLVSIRGLQVFYPIKSGLFQQTVGHVRAVDSVDLDIPKGSTVALVGESGCGKTSLGKALLHIVKPAGGRVLFDGTDLTSLPRRELKPFRRRLQIVFQDPFGSLNPRMMVGEILAEGMEVHGIGENRQDRQDRAVDLLHRVGLSADVVNRYPHAFSGGQRQRIGIARALAVEPEFIVCDEPTSALDVSVQAQIINLLEELQADLGLTYLLITHDLSVVEYIADEVAVMYLGKIVERGTREEIFEQPKHPYTRALLSAIPQTDPESGVQKITLPGDVPSPISPPDGCHFHPRCLDRLPHCADAYPEETIFTSTHACRCYLHSTTSETVEITPT